MSVRAAYVDMFVLSAHLLPQGKVTLILSIKVLPLYYASFLNHRGRNTSCEKSGSIFAA